jgi:hypothetical protein
MLHGPTRPRPEPERTRGRHSGESRSGQRARRSRAFCDERAGSRGARSSGCTSSRGSPPPEPRSTRRRARRRRRKAMGGGLPPRGGSLRPPSPRATEAAEEMAPRAGAGAPATRQPTREASRATEAPARPAEMTGGAVTATRVVATTSTEPSRKSKRGFSTLR